MCYSIVQYGWSIQFLFHKLVQGNAPQAMAIMRYIALNLLRQYKAERQSIKGLRKMCSWDSSLLDQIITQKNLHEAEMHFAMCWSRIFFDPFLEYTQI